jgi:VWFA-related protein
MRRRVAKVAFALLFLVIVAGLLEFSASQLVKRGVWKVAPPNAYSPESQFYDGTHPIFGVWHLPNAEIEHPRVCFKVRYVSNSVGSRDRERERRSDDPRVIFLGDSFIEGWGLEVEQRLSDRLERATGIEHLNFGMSYFGPYQSLLAYRHLAKGFDHTDVIMAILPENDFIDIDLDLALEIADYSYRYRPYLRKTPDGYERFDYRENRLRRLLRRHSYSYGAARVAAANLRHRLSRHEIEEPLNSRFYDFTDEQFDRLEYILAELADEAEGKRLTVLLLPTVRDFDSYRPGMPTPLSQRLEAVGAREGFRIIDLLPFMAAQTEEWERYSFSCDYHWSSYANWVAARAVFSELRGVSEVSERGAPHIEPVDRTDLVNVHLVARDTDGRYVSDLSGDGIRIFENRELQEVVHFSKSHQPLRIAVVLDSSLDMLRGDRLAQVKKAALQFLDTLEPNDEGLVVSFSETVNVLQGPTPEHGLLTNAIRAAKPSSGTALYDAVWQAAQHLAPFEGRRVLVLLSAGRDEASSGLEPGSLHTFDDVLDTLVRSQVMVFSIGLGNNLDRENVARWPTNDDSANLDASRILLDELRQWAAYTGGRTVIARNAGNLPDAFSEIAADLRNQFSIGYVPSDPKRDGEWRKIDIETPGRAFEVNAREGYYAPLDAGPGGP